MYSNEMLNPVELINPMSSASRMTVMFNPISFGLDSHLYLIALWIVYAGDF